MGRGGAGRFAHARLRAVQAAAGAADAKARSLNRVNAERSAPLGTEGDPTDALTRSGGEHESAGGEKELQPHSRLYEKLAAFEQQSKKNICKGMV